MVTVRKARSSDAAGILACLSAAFAPFENSYTKEAYSDTVLTMKTLQERLRSMTLFIAVSAAGGVAGTIGCAKVDEQEGHLRGMAVLPEWQGTCIAAQLLERAEFELRHLGCRRVSLDTTAPLKRAVQFYKRHGYQPTGRVTDFFGMKLFEYSKNL
ncbi:MAG TPA: GNAT family N-acetyltransferase [Candidatus Angelobacter sp.]|jgi:GNAT superfamily N-acetyltransferase|nr:GNAT family N-acetyltransferase [Candidatus Angelobacter sp.]